MPMRWEYVEVDFEYYRVVGDLAALTREDYISYADIGDGQKIHLGSTVLDFMGSRGWELVSVVPILNDDKPANHTLRAFLKRQLD